MTLICTNNFHNDDMIWINADKIKTFYIHEQTEELEGISDTYTGYLAKGGQIIKYCDKARQKITYSELRVEIDGTGGFVILARSFDAEELKKIMNSVRIDFLTCGGSDISKETENANLTFLEKRHEIQKILNDVTDGRMKEYLEEREGVEK